MNLGFSLTFNDLHTLDGLHKLDRAFLIFLNENACDLYDHLIDLRKYNNNIDNSEYSKFLLEIAPLLEDFLAEVFFIKEVVLSSTIEQKRFDEVLVCKRDFVRRIAIKKYPKDVMDSIDIEDVTSKLELFIKNRICAFSFASCVMQWMQSPDMRSIELDTAAKYAAFIVHHDLSDDILFSLPSKIDATNLIDEAKIAKLKKFNRSGFDYNRDELSAERAVMHANYCIYCHKQDKDYCSKGLLGASSKNKTGCPLKQKISEMNYLKASGFNIAALAVVMLDNPMVAATGHRICNACSSSCIYQKQEPVDVPLVESNIAQTLFDLPYGVEIYLLLTRWNPLSINAFLPKEATGYNVLVVGTGPAGFSLAHYLLNEGHNVTAIDGLKITKLPFDVQAPIKYWSEYKSKLSKIMPQGFGGVMQYGITARWDKSNLAILRLILERRSNFKLYDSVRLGSNITARQAFDLGFDHIALCVGAGAPKILPIKNALISGVKTAADFLMSLQLYGAYHASSNSNLTIRMPVVVIGCGLTAIDAAVEAMYYYPLHVERFLQKYEALIANQNIDDVTKHWSEKDKALAQEFIRHAILFRDAKSKDEILDIMNVLGGVSIYYRKQVNESTAYASNHNEIMYALAAGVKFYEDMTPVAFNADKYNCLRSIEFVSTTVEAKTALFAVGIDDYIDLATFIDDDSNRYSYFGDCDPEFAGSVVHAIASSKYGFSKITQNLLNNKPNYSNDYTKFVADLDAALLSTVYAIHPLHSNKIKLVIHSALASKNFQAGQLFRLQNYSDDQNKLSKPLALTCVASDNDNKTISFIISLVGRSTNLYKQLKAGDYVALMGPVGISIADIHVSQNQYRNVLLIGKDINNVALLSIAKHFWQNNCTVTYIAGYASYEDCLFREDIQNFSNYVIWCYRTGVVTQNGYDVTIHGSVVDGFLQYISTMNNKTDLIICCAPVNTIQEIKRIKDNILGNQARLICNINAHMQCMMKGICGQCLQATLNNNGYMFACACQYQDASMIDFSCVNDRLAQNSLFEKI